MGKTTPPEKATKLTEWTARGRDIALNEMSQRRSGKR
jgi:hypothetical protein